jgi:hypothetical protein
MEVIKVEPDFDTESLNESSFHEDRDEDPLLINTDVVKKEVKVSFILIHTLCKESRECKLSLTQANGIKLCFIVTSKYYWPCVF